MNISPDPISSRHRRDVTKSSLQPKPNPRLVQPQIEPQPNGARSPDLKDFSHSRWVDFQRWAREFSYSLAINRYAFWGLIVLAGSLVIGTLTKGYEVLWRSTASLGIALVVIGCIRAWIEAHSSREGSASRGKRGAKKQ